MTCSFEGLCKTKLYIRLRDCVVQRYPVVMSTYLGIMGRVLLQNSSFFSSLLTQMAPECNQEVRLDVRPSFLSPQHQFLCMSPRDKVAVKKESFWSRLKVMSQRVTKGEFRPLNLCLLHSKNQMLTSLDSISTIFAYCNLPIATLVSINIKMCIIVRLIYKIQNRKFNEKHKIIVLLTFFNPIETYFKKKKIHEHTISECTFCWFCFLVFQNFFSCLFFPFHFSINKLLCSVCTIDRELKYKQKQNQEGQKIPK